MYGSFWYCADMQGNYGGIVSPLLGKLSGVPSSVEYRMWTGRVGAVYTVPKTRYFVDFNISADREDIRNNAPANAVRGIVQLGAGAHF